MRKLTAILCLTITLTSILSGCQTNIRVPDSAVFKKTPHQTFSFTGNYKTGDGTLRLKQEGNRVTGFVGRLNLNGVVDGNSLSGNQGRDDDRRGTFYWLMSDDGNSYKGYFINYHGIRGEWSGIRLTKALPVKLEKSKTTKFSELENERLRRENARLRKERQSKPKQVAKKPPPKKAPQPAVGSTGSGFFVSKLGHIITNEHVVRQCGSVTVGDNANKQVSASVVEKDKRNDLALLRISSTKMASAETKSLISKLNVQKLGLKVVPLASEGLVRSDDVELGEDVLVAGYPYGELFSDTIKVTKGIVSANKGMGDDSGQFQMDAAVQSGNSGGPIYDENGNIVGVVVAQLNKLKVAKAIGSLPENVNFGIKASTVRQFLTSAGLPTKWSNRTERKSTKELAQIAKNQTVMVVCNP